MAYDVLGESIRLIADGLPAGPVTLSRRHRFAPLAVDVDGDHAATRFLRRGTGGYHDETHLLTRTSDSWTYHGGGGSTSFERWSADEFARARAAVPPDGLEHSGGASVRLSSHRWLPTPGRWLHATQVVAGVDVTEVVVDGGRRLAVPPHGHLVVVWTSRREPRLTPRPAGSRD